MISLDGAVAEADVALVPDDLDGLLTAAHDFADAVGAARQCTAHATNAWAQVPTVLELTAASTALDPLMAPADASAHAIADAGDRLLEAVVSGGAHLGRLRDDATHLVRQVTEFADDAPHVAFRWATHQALTTGVVPGVWSWREVPELVETETVLRSRVEAHNTDVARALSDTARRIEEIGAPASAFTPGTGLPGTNPSDTSTGTGHWWDGVWHTTQDVAAEAGNLTLSVLDAATSHPGDLATMAGGLLLAAAGAGTEIGGVALDLTGAGAVAGVPANIAGAGLIVSGLAVSTGAAVDLGTHAMTDNRVEKFDTDHRAAARERASADDESAPSDEASVREKLSTLRKGNQKPVRVVDSDDEVDAIFEEMARGGRPIETITYKGTWYELPDGTRIGLRTDSLSGGHTIDIRFPGSTRKWKVHTE